MKTDCLKGINTLRYSDIFLAMYSDNGSSCLHRNHSHVLVYMYSGELEIKEHEKVTGLHKGDCAFIRKDFSVQLTKQAYKGEQFKAIFLMFTDKFLRGFLQPPGQGKPAARCTAEQSQPLQTAVQPSRHRKPVRVHDPLFQFRHPAYGRTAGAEDDRRIVHTPEYRQEPVCLAFRLCRPVEDRYHELHGTELHQRPLVGGNGQLHRTKPCHIQTGFQ